MMDWLFIRLILHAFLHEEPDVRRAAWIITACLVLSIALVVVLFWSR